jgi:hypothetical protein
LIYTSDTKQDVFCCCNLWKRARILILKTTKWRTHLFSVCGAIFLDGHDEENYTVQPQLHISGSADGCERAGGVLALVEFIHSQSKETASRYYWMRLRPLMQPPVERTRSGGSQGARRYLGNLSHG